MFEVQKTLAIAEVMMNAPKTYSAVLASASQIPLIGPYIAPGLAAGAVTMQMAQAALIGNVTFNPGGFAEGGFTGYGGKYEPAGIVHRGEGVLTQEEIKAIGGPAGFNALRDSIHNGYSEGGFVLDDSKSFSAITPSYMRDVTPQSPQVSVVVENHTSGQVQTSMDQDGRLRVIIREVIDQHVPSQLGSPNSRISKAISQNTTSSRRR